LVEGIGSSDVNAKFPQISDFAVMCGERDRLSNVQALLLLIEFTIPVA
jgi:hypothetical protein